MVNKRASHPYLSMGDAVISATTLAEFELGVACSGPSHAKHQNALSGLLKNSVGEFEVKAAQSYGPLCVAHPEGNNNSGVNLDFTPLLISATGTW